MPIANKSTGWCAQPFSLYFPEFFHSLRKLQLFDSRSNQEEKHLRRTISMQFNSDWSFYLAVKLSGENYGMRLAEYAILQLLISTSIWLRLNWQKLWSEKYMRIGSIATKQNVPCSCYLLLRHYILEIFWIQFDCAPNSLVVFLRIEVDAKLVKICKKRNGKMAVKLM